MNNATDSKQGEARPPCDYRNKECAAYGYTIGSRWVCTKHVCEQLQQCWLNARTPRTFLAAVEEDGSTATIAWRIVTNYYPDDDELADAIKAALDNERRLLTVKGNNPLLSSEVAEKIAKHIRGKNSDYFSTKDGLAELESITSRHFAAAASSPLPAEKDDGWVTFGRVKADIENETETFERISPLPAAACEGE